MRHPTPVQFAGAECVVAVLELTGLGGANHPLAMRARMLVVGLLPARGWFEALQESLLEQQEAYEELCSWHDERAAARPARPPLKLPGSAHALFQLVELLVQAASRWQPPGDAGVSDGAGDGRRFGRCRA